jgi:hypothetical protein
MPQYKLSSPYLNTPNTNLLGVLRKYGNRIVSFPDPITMVTTNTFLPSELDEIEDIFSCTEVLDRIGTAKFRRLTPAQIDTRIAAISTLAQAKEVLSTLAQIVRYLLDKELNRGG